MPRLPSSADVQQVSPRIANDPGLNVPSVRSVQGAFDSPVGIAAQELAPGLARMAEVAQKQENRRETVDRADRINQYAMTADEELRRLNTESDLSKEEVLQEYGQLLATRRQELLQQHGGSDDSIATLSIRLQELESQAVGKAAAISTKLGREKVLKVYNDRLNPLLQNVAQDASPENIDQTMLMLENQISDLSGAFDPNEEETLLRSTGREEIALSALDSLIIRGRAEEAETLLDNHLLNSLAPQNQRVVRGRIQNVYAAREEAARQVQITLAVERAKLQAKRENISMILNNFGASPVGKPGVGESPATVTPFGEGQPASADTQDAMRLFSASRRLFMAGEGEMANGMLSQARFILENSPQVQREKELDKPISEELAREFGVPAGTPLRTVMDIIPRSPEELAEDKAAAAARGKGKIEGEEHVAFIDEASIMVKDLLDEVKLDPTLVGVGGSLRSTGQAAAGILGDLGMNALVDSAKDIAFEGTDISLEEANGLFDDPTLSVLHVLENSIGLILARLRAPDGRIPVDVIKRSIDDVKLTGLKSSEQVQNRLNFVLGQLNRRASALERRFKLPSTRVVEQPRFIVKDGQLVPVGGSDGDN